ncbi:MAG: hypothetical protein J7642_02740 [Cyanobacteria bacterium SBC]|nr:hypothetical protein [Cyanobacteria bacterium SBC]
MLLRLDRVDEAIENAAMVQTKQDANRIASASANCGELAAALDLAFRGLGLDLVRLDEQPLEYLYDDRSSDGGSNDSEYDFANWTSDLARQVGRHDRALEAKILGFELQPNYGDYLPLQSASGDTWETLKLRLLKALKTSRYWQIKSARVQLYLFEDLLDESIAVVDKLSSSDALIQEVMNEVLFERPEWVLNNSKQRAEPILKAKDAKYYDDEIDWLKYTKKAYEQLDRLGKWVDYRLKLQQIHGRKYKFINLLKSSGL